MATLYADEKGNLLRLLLTDEQAELYGEPDGYAHAVEFDLMTNPALMDALNTRWNDLSVADGAVLLAGKALALNADGADEAERKALPQAVALLYAYLDIAIPPAAQREGALKALIRVTLAARRNGG